jgi:hypothetical protein
MYALIVLPVSSVYNWWWNRRGWKVGKNLLATWTLTHIFILLKIGPFDLIFGLTCRPWSCLLYCCLWYSLHCVAVEQFAILKKIPRFARCSASSLLGVAHVPNKAPGLVCSGPLALFSNPHHTFTTARNLKHQYHSSTPMIFQVLA